MFGIVFLEVWDRINLPNIGYTWEINGKTYSGNRIALRVIDFFPSLTLPFGSVSNIILTSHDGLCPQSITVSVNDSQIDVADYLPPANMTLHLVDYFAGDPAIYNYLPSVMQMAEAIYSGNGNDIDWINYEIATISNLGIEDLPVLTDVAVELFQNGNNTSGFYWRSRLRASYLSINSGSNTTERFAHIMAHETLHVLLNRLGMLLYGSPRYFQHEYAQGPLQGGPHIDQAHPGVNAFGKNLNTDGSMVTDDDDYANARRIYPVQRYYVQKFWDYFYLLDDDLMAALSPVINQTITPHFSRWQTLRNRFKIILKDGNGISYSSYQNYEYVELEQQDFYSNNPFIFD